MAEPSYVHRGLDQEKGEVVGPRSAAWTWVICCGGALHLHPPGQSGALQRQVGSGVRQPRLHHTPMTHRWPDAVLGAHQKQSHP